MKTMLTFSMIMLGITLSHLTVNAQEKDVVFFEDFESGWGSWYADNGLWEVGIPIVGPENTHSGQNCAGTDLDANYPYSANTRLISPQISLPSGYIRLQFWHYHDIGYGDWGKIQVSTDGINWETVSPRNYIYTSQTWTQVCIDISAFTDETIRIGFYFTANNDLSFGEGWYIDDLKIIEGDELFNNPEDFENGTGDWSADNGLWQVGIPSNGPSYTHSGQNCASTDLDANYPSYANTRLVSPLITLTTVTGQQPELFFWHWYIMNGGELGQVEISVNDGEWQTVPGFGGPYNGSNETWSQAYVPLSAFIDSTIRLGFYFTSDYYDLDAGWYIDDVRIEGATVSINEYIAGSNNPSLILHQNYPNPFSNQTTISFKITENDVDINLSVYNSFGQLVKSLMNTRYKKGNYSFTWNGRDESGMKALPGIYFLKLKSERYSETMRIAIVN